MQITLPRALLFLGIICGLGFISQAQAGPPEGVNEPTYDIEEGCFENPCNEEEVCFIGVAIGHEREHELPNGGETGGGVVRLLAVGEDGLENDYVVRGMEGENFVVNNAQERDGEHGILHFMSKTGPDFYCFERESAGQEDEGEGCVCLDKSQAP